MNNDHRWGNLSRLNLTEVWFHELVHDLPSTVIPLGVGVVENRLSFGLMLSVGAVRTSPSLSSTPTSLTCSLPVLDVNGLFPCIRLTPRGGP